MALSDPIKNDNYTPYNRLEAYILYKIINPNTRRKKSLFYERLKIYDELKHIELVEEEISKVFDQLNEYSDDPSDFGLIKDCLNFDGFPHGDDLQYDEHGDPAFTVFEFLKIILDNKIISQYDYEQSNYFIFPKSFNTNEDVSLKEFSQLDFKGIEIPYSTIEITILIWYLNELLVIQKSKSNSSQKATGLASSLSINNVETIYNYLVDEKIIYNEPHSKMLFSKIFNDDFKIFDQPIKLLKTPLLIGYLFRHLFFKGYINKSEWDTVLLANKVFIQKKGQSVRKDQFGKKLRIQYKKMEEEFKSNYKHLNTTQQTYYDIKVLIENIDSR